MGDVKDSDVSMKISSQSRVGLLYDERMCNHCTPDGEDHPENPNRIRAIWSKLQAKGIPERCVLLDAKMAEDKHLLAVHSQRHVDLIKNISSKTLYSRNRIAARLNSIYFNEGSSEAAYLAAGSVVEVADKVAKGEVDSAAAIVRPPGHHAEHDEAMGFCVFNNVAVAARFLLDERQELGIKKILIVDWDVHHGNSTQKMFWTDSRVLFFSVHRHEFGTFYPANDDGFYTNVGEGAGEGYNINVPWENGRCGDSDYLAVWDHVLIPVAKEFDPDIIIVSAGFDAAAGDPLGGCRITPYGYSVLLEKLMGFGNGKVVLAFEGGYNLDSIANSFLACMEVLLERKRIAGSSEAYPFESTWRVIQEVRRKLSAYWPVLADELPQVLTSQKAPHPHLLFSSSDSEAEDEHTSISEKVEADLLEVMEPLSKLTVGGHADGTASCPPWRPVLSKTDIWYATFGSNMWQSRFRCYIEGGRVEGMQKACVGSVDKNPPKDIMWRTFPHRLFFGRESTSTWGPGGVAFLHPESSNDEKTYLCLYRITLEQFNDVLLQENVSSHDMSSPVFDLTDLSTAENQGSIPLEVFKNGWYHNVVYLGKEHDLPILTMTCTLSDVEMFRSGEIPLRAPCKEYANTLIRGLVEGGQLSEEEANSYIKEAASVCNQRLMAPLATLLDVDADVLRKQWWSMPMKLRALWKKLSQPRRNILRERGMDFIQFMQIGDYIKHLVFWLLGHFNLRTLTITAAEGKSLTIDEAHVCRIYGLQRGTKRVSDYLEPTVAEVKLWAEDLGLPYGNKAFVTLSELSDCMDAESDVEKWFIMYVLYFVGCLVKPLSNQNISLSYLGLFYRRDAPDFENLDWPQHILEVIQNAEEKSYVEYDIFLLMIFFLDMAAVREGDKLPSLTPSIRNWSNAAIEQHLTRLGDVCNLHRIHIVKWNPSEIMEKRPRSEGEEKAIEEVGGEVPVAKESGRSVRRRRVEKDREEDLSLVSVEKGAGNSNRTSRCGESVVPHLVTDKPICPNSPSTPCDTNS